MIILLTKRATKEQIQDAANDLDGYIKFVADVDLEIITIGGERHFEAEQLLLKQGSKQENLWGGGVDWKTKAVDYDSMINIRPRQNNPSKEILSVEVREKIDAILRKILL